MDHNKSVPWHNQLAKLLDDSVTLSEFSETALKLLLGNLQIAHMALAVYEEEMGIVSFPYSSNPIEHGNTLTYRDLNSPLKALLLQDISMIVTDTEYLDHCQDKSILQSIPKVWAGCPIEYKGKTIAALMLSSEKDEQVKSIHELFDSIELYAETLAPYLAAKIQFTNLASDEVKYRRLAESSLEITYQITLKGYISYVSSNIKSVLGIDPSKLIGMHFEQFTPPEQVSSVLQALADVAKEQEVSNLRLTPLKPVMNMSQLEITASPIYKKGQVIGAQGSVRDISEKHQAQQEIERLSFFPKTNPMPVVEIDKDGTPQYINPAGIHLLDRMGLDMSQVSLILPTTFKQDLETALSQNTLIPAREVSLDGNYLLWSAFFLENQEIMHYYGTDITAQKNTEMELIEAQQVAVKNEQVKTLFLANMSHEIRTPLNSILGFLELIEEEVKLKYDQDLRSYFEIIRASGKRLWQTVHEILDISQIETGTFPLKIEIVDLTKILKELNKTYSAAAKEKNIKLIVNIPEEIFWIPADEYCTTQALSNILDNAIKYTNEGQVALSVLRLKDSIEVKIEDTGIGMSKAYLEQIFNAFSQESTGYTKHFQGVGLGLALAHRYLKLIDSEISLTSEQNEGTKFVISFPIEKHKNPLEIHQEMYNTAENNTAEAVSPNSKKSILVVEDDANSKKLAELILKSEFELHFAESVYEAREVLKETAVHLILLDLSLKGNEDGLDLARYIRNDSPFKNLPIIALTAHAFTTDRDNCFNVGCNEFITKPYRKTDLIELIHKLT